MKIPLQCIDEFEQELFDEGYDGFFDHKLILAEELKAPLSSIEYYYHGVVDEWVINVDGKFYGYVEDDYFDMFSPQG